MTDVRQIMIKVSHLNKVFTVETNASTYKELLYAIKDQYEASPEDTFTEVNSKTILINNPEAQLPTEVFYRGEPTKNLAFMVTRNTNIKNGALSEERQKYYDFIKSNNMSAFIKSNYGSNYTNLKTEVLGQIVSEYQEGNTVDIKDNDNIKALFKIVLQFLYWIKNNLDQSEDNLQSEESIVNADKTTKVDNPFPEDVFNQL